MTDRTTSAFVATVAAGSHELDTVIAMSKRYQATLGQLPFEAFRDFARAGRVLGAFRDEVLVGYALYRMRRRSGVLVLVHLCVDDVARGQGVADQLIDSVCARHPFSPGLTAWCREDYPANRRWPSLGFGRTGGERVGRGRDGRLLVHWWRSINDVNLFTFDATTELIPAAAIDTNVFRDIYEPRPEFEESLALAEPWLQDSIELVTTAQLNTEVDVACRTAAALKGARSRLRSLTPPPDAWRPILHELVQTLGQSAVEEADLRQVAQASAGGARYFVTRDRALLSHGGDVDTIAGICVVSPLDLMLAVHADQFEVDYQAAALRESELQVLHPQALPATSELVNFTDHSSSERSSELAAELRQIAPGVSAGARMWALAPADGPTVVIAATSGTASTLVVHCLRVRSGRHQLTFARQMLHLLREEVVATGRTLVEVTGSTPSYVQSALGAEGFVRDGNRWVARCIVGIVGPGDEVPHGGAAVEASSLEPAEVSALERTLWPLKIVNGVVPTYIVPIKPAWARALFGDDPQAELFARPSVLSVAREHVYYRSLSRTIVGPARLLWWVSGGGHNGGMRASSWLESAVIGRPRTLYKQFGTQGIYKQQDVENLVGRPGGEALALVFSRTETFRNRIDLATARELFAPMGRNGYLQSTQRVDEHVFATFYRTGTGVK